MADQEPAQPQSSPPPSTQGGHSGAKPPPPPIHWQTEAIAKREQRSSSLGRAALDVVRMVIHGDNGDG